MSNINKTSLYIPAYLHKELKIYSATTGVKVNDLILKAIENYLSNKG